MTFHSLLLILHFSAAIITTCTAEPIGNISLQKGHGTITPPSFNSTQASFRSTVKPFDQMSNILSTFNLTHITASEEPSSILPSLHPTHVTSVQLTEELSSILPSMNPTSVQPTSVQPTTEQPSSILPSLNPTHVTSVQPTEELSSILPSMNPTSVQPTSPTEQPSAQPSTMFPSIKPTSKQPTASPTVRPSTMFPSIKPTSKQPTAPPTVRPSTMFPSIKPTAFASKQPSARPSGRPSSKSPSIKPSSKQPTVRPTVRPTIKPTTLASKQPSARPSGRPSSKSPSIKPSSKQPTVRPTIRPTIKPTVLSSTQPTQQPSARPSTTIPSLNPSYLSSGQPTEQPSDQPSTMIPSIKPTALATTQPTVRPTVRPSTMFPSIKPTALATTQPTVRPTPSEQPTEQPSDQPSTMIPSKKPTKKPTVRPTVRPSSKSPSIKSTEQPSRSTTACTIPAPGPNAICIEGVGYVYVLALYGSVKVNNNNGFTMNGGGRIYFATKNAPLGGGNSDIYWIPNLLGTKLSFVVDLSQVDCGCNAATYFTQMPGFDANGNAYLSAGNDYYCDANKVQGNFCPEHDILESNKYAIQTALHTCTSNPNQPKNFITCDGPGCGTNSYRVSKTAMCPSTVGVCTIDSMKPFKVTITHHQTNNVFDFVNFKMEQGNKVAEYNVCNNPYYLTSFQSSMDKMAFVIALWGGPGQMTWLDGETGCAETCNVGLAKVTFSNFAITSQ
eukprot:gene24243-32675_t